VTQRDTFINYQKGEVNKRYRDAPGRCDPNSPFHDCSGLPSAAMVVAGAEPPGFCLDTTGWTDLLHAHPECLAPLSTVRVTPGMIAIRPKNTPGYPLTSGHMVTSLGLINGVARTVEAHDTADGIIIGYFDGNRGFQHGGRPPGLNGFTGAPGAPQTLKPGVGMDWMVVPHPSGKGYVEVDAAGLTYYYGVTDVGGCHRPAEAGHPTVTPDGTIIGAAFTPAGNGLWMCDGHGHIYTFGSAPYLGGQGSPVPGNPSQKVNLGSAATSFSAHPAKGYWIADSLGQIYAFGGAPRPGDAYGNPHT
jgi:hypothetical protein